MSAPIVLVRRRTGPTRAVGALTSLVPLALGVYWIVRGGSLGMQILGAVAALAGLFAARTNLRFAGRVEIEGDQAVIKALWTGARRTVDLRRLAAVEARLAQRPADGGVFALSYILLFEDGERVFLGQDFDGLEEGVSRAIRSASPDGVALPARVGGVLLGSWNRYLQDPRLGCSASYPERDRLVSVYAYRGDTKDVADGADSPEVIAELAKAEGDLRTAAARDGRGEPEEVGRGILGEGGDWPMRWVGFHFGGSPDPRMELVLLCGHRGVLLKVRHTRRPPGDAAAAESAAEEVRRFVAELAAAT